MAFDPQFLAWAYTQRSTSSLARYLGVGRTTLRNVLLDYGIAQAQSDPFAEPVPADVPPDARAPDHLADDDDLLDPLLPVERQVISFTGPLSSISDNVLDSQIRELRTHYR